MKGWPQKGNVENVKTQKKNKNENPDSFSYRGSYQVLVLVSVLHVLFVWRSLRLIRKSAPY